MAQKPDGKAARIERVTFTKPAADRIAKVVRTIELGRRDASGLAFGALPEPSKTLRVCKFTGSWTKGTTKLVTFLNQTSTPNTAVASNLFATISGVTATSTTKNCAIARDGTAWYLIAAECS
jgi:hypothetical protein